jgi:uncharacterized membrane protein YfbV (UPF0208 family)
VNSQVPIMLDYYDAKSPSSQLVATFTKCEFRVSADQKRKEKVRLFAVLVADFIHLFLGQSLFWHGIHALTDLCQQCAEFNRNSTVSF